MYLLLGTTNTVCLLTVKRPKEEIKREGEEPMFTKGLVDKWIDRGASLMLNCVVTGTPTPEIKWYYFSSQYTALQRVLCTLFYFLY